MKNLKMLGLATIAALSLMASAGAGSASATTLFTDEAKTAAYVGGTTIQMELAGGSTAALTSGGSTVATCTSSSTFGTTNTITSTYLSAKMTSLTWGGCSQTTDTLFNGSVEIKWSSGSNGDFYGYFTDITVQIFGVSCTYGNLTSQKLGTITGGSFPIVKISGTLLKRAGGFLCPNSVGWDAEYVVTTPHALYVGS